VARRDPARPLDLGGIECPNQLTGDDPVQARRHEPLASDKRTAHEDPVALLVEDLQGPWD
jgi:hypothetical protein